MKKIVFATNNLHKLEEVRAILNDKVEIISLAETGCTEDIPETAETLEENAAIKAKYVFDNYHTDCFADDTGLEIEALGGKPGVYSARYAGEPANSARNIQQVLSEMEGQENRRAQFRTVIVLMQHGVSRSFEGIIKGKIASEPRGNAGFGYDPIFIPESYTESFAELSADVKNTISHRALAIEKLRNYLEKQYLQD